MRVLWLATFMLLAACAAPKNAVDIKAAEPPPAMSIEEKNATQTPDVTIEEKTTAVKPGEVDFSCKNDSDCKIKDVGSCCGYRPACVNKDSETFPEAVKAQCGKSGMSGIAAFPASAVAPARTTNAKASLVRT